MIGIGETGGSAGGTETTGLGPNVVARRGPGFDGSSRCEDLETLLGSEHGMRKDGGCRLEDPSWLGMQGDFCGRERPLTPVVMAVLASWLRAA